MVYNIDRSIQSSSTVARRDQSSTRKKPKKKFCYKNLVKSAGSKKPGHEMSGRHNYE